MQFWFEFASTYSYPAALRVEALARRHGVPLEWKAFLLGPIFQAQGLERFAVQSFFRFRGAICGGIWSASAPIWNCPSADPVDSRNAGVLAARIACRFASEPWLPDFVRAVFRANFAEDQDIAQPEVLEQCLNRLDLPGAELLQQAQSPE